MARATALLFVLAPARGASLCPAPSCGVSQRMAWVGSPFKRGGGQALMRVVAQADPHKILGVDRGASDVALKKAFKKAALKYHPDRNQEKG